MIPLLSGEQLGGVMYTLYHRPEVRIFFLILVQGPIGNLEFFDILTNRQYINIAANSNNSVGSNVLENGTFEICLTSHVRSEK